MAKLPRNIDLDLNLPRPPFWMIAALLVLVVLTWTPLAFIALTRVSVSDERPIELFQGMRTQPRHNAQSPSNLFADGRAMRPEVPGTVARGRLNEEDHYYRGYEMVQNEETGEWEAEFFQGMPPEVEVTENLLLRGQERFDVYCYPCHGYDGTGQGPIHVRASELTRSPRRTQGTVWVPPSNLHELDAATGQRQFGRENMPDGELFHVISEGRRNMAGYSQIDVDDRWAIVAYVRALQLSQGVPAEDLTEEELQRLEPEPAAE